MAKPDEDYAWVLVESYRPANTSGLRGKIHIRPCAGQGYPENLHVECAKNLSRDYPVGTKFRIWAKLTDREGGGEFLYTHFRWEVELVELGAADG